MYLGTIRKINCVSRNRVVPKSMSISRTNFTKKKKNASGAPKISIKIDIKNDEVKFQPVYLSYVKY